ncbi:MAG: DUF5074 domain-containing protein, partial [Catalinimonas sp.]
VASVFVLLLWACNPDEPPPPTLPDADSTRGVFIANEGNFGSGNASLSYLDLPTDQMSNGLFAAVNSGRPLGDVLQSVTLRDSLAYLVVNNSGKIAIIHNRTFAVVDSVVGLVSPRYLLFVSATKAYCSDLYADAVSVIDVPSRRVIKQIPLPGWTEELQLVDGRVFVTNLRRRYLYVLDPATDRLVDSVDVGGGNNSLQLDREGQLWVACGAAVADVAAPALVRVDPRTLLVTKRLAAPSGSPSSLRINGGADTLYYLSGNEAFRLPVAASDQIPTRPFVAGRSGEDFYGLGVEPTSGEVYVADARRFTARGRVLRYRPDGTLRGTYGVGVGPGAFAFAVE